MITKKIESIMWGISGLILLIIAVLHPRIIYWILVVVCGISSIVCYRTTRKTTVGKLCKNIIGNIVGILILCYLGQNLNILFPYHASYEYKKDIAVLKEDFLQEYYYFPDEIPAVASDVKWMCFPSLLQGSGYHKLFFYADESYLQKIYNTFAENATVYTYDQYGWINSDNNKAAIFPGASSIDESERKNVKVYILYDNQDVNHLHNGGFYINQTDGYVCFWAQ